LFVADSGDCRECALAKNKRLQKNKSACVELPIKLGVCAN
jgi:hypothetical protein